MELINKIMDAPNLSAVKLRVLKPGHKNHSNRLVISVENGFHIIPFEDIARIQAQNNYCLIFLRNGKFVLSSKTLKSVAVLFPSEAFIRIHQSHMVCKDLIRFMKGDCLTLDGGETLPISRSRRKETHAAIITQ